LIEKVIPQERTHFKFRKQHQFKQLGVPAIELEYLFIHTWTKDGSKYWTRAPIHTSN